MNRRDESCAKALIQSAIPGGARCSHRCAHSCRLRDWAARLAFTRPV